jgi:hypothetical protein
MFRKPGQWFSQSSYTWAGNNQFGNVSTGSMYGPRFQKWDLALAKNTSIGEYVKVQLRVEAFNIANHPNFNQVSASIDSLSFGTVTTDHEPRLLQMGGKFTF